MAEKTRLLSVRKNRRKGKDTLTKLVAFISVLCWVLMASVMTLLAVSRPRVEQSYSASEALSGFIWDGSLLSYSYYLLIAETGLCIIGIVLNSFRIKRKTDRYNTSLFFLLLISLLVVFVTFLM